MLSFNEVFDLSVEYFVKLYIWCSGIILVIDSSCFGFGYGGCSVVCECVVIIIVGIYVFFFCFSCCVFCRFLCFVVIGFFGFGFFGFCIRFVNCFWSSFWFWWIFFCEFYFF